MGVGAEQMALGGAASAGTLDLYSLFWNPAGLVEMEQSQFSVSKQLNSELLPVNFIGVGVVGERLNFFGLKSALAFALIPRLHAASSGAYAESDLESMFLRYALPGLPGNFDGEIETKTKDYRFSWAVSPMNDPRWALGLSVSRIECATASCGVTAEDPGNYTVRSANATAYAFHLGAKYFYSESLNFGINIEDINTKLKLEVVTTDQLGTRNETYNVPFPRDITLGMQWKYSPAVRFSADYQNISGSYGEYVVDMQVARGGVAYRTERLEYRAGLIYPLKINSDKFGDIKSELRYPIAPTAGVGWRGGRFKVDLVGYVNPLMSHHYGRPWPAADLTVIYSF